LIQGGKGFTMHSENCAIRVAPVFFVLVMMLPAISRAQLDLSVSTPAHGGSTTQAGGQEADRVELAPIAAQTAHILGIDSLIARISYVSTAKEVRLSGGPSLEELSLRQQIAETVITASLDVDSVLDRIDYERAQVIELRNNLRSRRDHAAGITNIAVLAMATGLGVVSGILQFSDSTKKAGDAVGFGAGGISALFSLRSLRQQHSGRRPEWVLPNMLAPLLDPSQEQPTHYPNYIWAYLNSVPLGEDSEVSRRERMVKEWQAAGRFGPQNAPQAKRQIALLTGTNTADKKLNIDVLSVRAAMLADVREAVSLMKRNLRDLLRGIKLSQ
jgi:hypothetical protein